MSGKRKVVLTILSAIIILAVLVAGIIYYVGHHYYSKTNYVSDEEAVAQIEEQKALRDAAGETEDDEDEELSDDPELREALENMERYASEEPITTDGNVYNIMLVGLDTTKDNWVGNSDSMILISINYRLHKISMISFMRDLSAYIPGIGYRKLNAAYPNGGGPLLLETIEYNYKIDVDRYVTVDFGNMIDIIDEIGTIEITFTEKEAENANKSIKQQCRILGLKSKNYLIPGEGTYECNGMQAVAYARIRKVGNSDYQRTQRQREVLMKMLDKVKNMDLDDLDRLAAKILPLLTHNVPESEFWGLLAKAPTLFNYNIVQDRVPYDGMYYSSNGNLVPTEGTIARLKATIYGEDAIDDEGNVIGSETGEETEQQTDGTGVPGDGTDNTTGSENIESRTAEAGTTENGTAEAGTTGTIDWENLEEAEEEVKPAEVTYWEALEEEEIRVLSPYEPVHFKLRRNKSARSGNFLLAPGDYLWKKAYTDSIVP